MSNNLITDSYSSSTPDIFLNNKNATSSLSSRPISSNLDLDAHDNNVDGTYADAGAGAGTEKVPQPYPISQNLTSKCKKYEFWCECDNKCLEWGKTCKTNCDEQTTRSKQYDCERDDTGKCINKYEIARKEAERLAEIERKIKQEAEIKRKTAEEAAAKQKAEEEETARVKAARQRQRQKAEEEETARVKATGRRSGRGSSSGRPSGKGKYLSYRERVGKADYLSHPYALML